MIYRLWLLTNPPGASAALASTCVLTYIISGTDIKLCAMAGYALLLRDKTVTSGVVLVGESLIQTNYHHLYRDELIFLKKQLHVQKIERRPSVPAYYCENEAI
jgi:hypothetical protein